MDTKRIIGLIILVLFLGAVAYFFVSSKNLAKGEIPSYVNEEKKVIYEWAKTPEGNDLLEQIPCYCGCKYDGHLHSRHCFWTDEGKFDAHGVTCSTCLDIAIKAKKLHEEGQDLCTIRKEIDSFYEPNKHLGTETPLPEGCE